MKHFGRYAAIVVLALGLTGGGVWYFTSHAQRADGAAYVTQPITRGTIRRVVSTSGPVRALITVSVGSQLSGQIIELKADFNSEVKQGDVLAMIDPKTFEVRVAQARADLSSSKATLINQTAALAKAKAILAQAERNKVRYAALSGRGVSTQAQLETATRDFEVARADLAVSEAQIAVARAQIAQREAALRQAEIDLERTIIRAPIEGTVISRTIDRGQTVAASLQAPELFKIAQDLSRIRIEAQVNEADVGNILAGHPATFTVDAYPDRTFEGKVTQVRLAATELQNVVTYTVIVEAANDDRKLFPGMTANVEIETDKRADVLRLPTAAVRFRPGPELEQARAGRGNRGAVWERRIAGLQKRLKLTDEQVTLLRQGVKELGAEMRAARGGGSRGGGGGEGDAGSGSADRAARREFARKRFDTLLKGILDDKQREAYVRWQKRERGTRTVTVWVIGVDGRPQRQSVRVGIGDENYLEVRRGAIKEGAQVVVRKTRRT